MLEINGNPNRRDLSEHHARLAARRRARRSSSTPTPTASTPSTTCATAIATARRAWLTKDDVANTRGWAEFKKLPTKRRISPKRQMPAPQPVGAQAGGPDQLHRLQGAVGHDVKSDAVALLDRRAPRPRGSARRGRPAARSRRRSIATPGKKMPRTPATTAVTPIGQRRAAAIRAGVSAGRLVAVRASASGVAHAVGGPRRPPQPEADRERRSATRRRRRRGSSDRVRRRPRSRRSRRARSPRRR